MAMRKGKQLAFVEVKYRKLQTMGGAISSVSPAKQARIIHSAQIFLQRYPLLNHLDSTRKCNFQRSGHRV